MGTTGDSKKLGVLLRQTVPRFSTPNSRPFDSPLSRYQNSQESAQRFGGTPEELVAYRE
jgi:hypothetical protein